MAEVVKQALKAANKMTQGDEVEDEEWDGFRKVLSGALPSWDQVQGDKKPSRETVKNIKESLRYAQGMARVMVETMLENGKRQEEFVQQRENSREWITHAANTQGMD